MTDIAGVPVPRATDPGIDHDEIEGLPGQTFAQRLRRTGLGGVDQLDLHFAAGAIGQGNELLCFFQIAGRRNDVPPALGQLTAEAKPDAA